MGSIKQPPMRQGSPDDFQTPKEALDILIPYLKKDWKIWECASGKGNLVNGLIDRGFYVVGTDILQGVDFINHAIAEDRNFKIDCIITNPPFTLKNEFLTRAFEINKPFAFLLPLTTLESEKRHRLFRQHKIQLIIPNKRYNFETPSGKGSGSWFATAWFCYKMNLPSDLNFIEIDAKFSYKKTRGPTTRWSIDYEKLNSQNLNSHLIRQNQLLKEKDNKDLNR